MATEGQALDKDSGGRNRTQEGKPRSRYIPRAVRRAVAERDGCRCTYVSPDGHRCSETARLELHHRTPYARGGGPTVAGLELRCRMHNDMQARFLAAILVASAVFYCARSRARTALLAFAAFHLHLAFDIMGSGAGWMITYFYPFSTAEFGITWGWELPSWQNFAVTLLFLAYSLRYAVVCERTFVEAWMPAVADTAFCRLVTRVWRRGYQSAGRT